MKKSKFTEQQIAFALQQAEGEVQEAELIPPGAKFRLEVHLPSDSKPGVPALGRSEFLEKWGNYSFVMKFDDKTFEETFSKEIVASRFTRQPRLTELRVTKRVIR